MVLYYRSARVVLIRGSLQCFSYPRLCLMSEDVRSFLYIPGDSEASHIFEQRVLDTFAGIIRGWGLKLGDIC